MFRVSGGFPLFPTYASRHPVVHPALPSRLGSRAIRPVITHHPLLIQIGPIQVTGFGIAVLAAFLMAQLIMQRELARRGHDVAVVPDLVFAALAGTFVGAKAYYVLIITHDWTTVFSRGGFVFWGGFVGAVAATAWVIHRRRLSFWQMSDVAGIAIAAGYAIGRTGCWAIGDDYGRPWSSRFAVAFPEGAPPSTAANLTSQFHVALPAGTLPSTVIGVYPTQLFEVALGLLMFGILWRNRDHRHAAGWLFGLYCVLAGIERFVVEIFRAKDDRFFGPFSSAQVVALLVTVLGVAVIQRRRVGRTPADLIHAVNPGSAANVA